MSLYTASELLGKDGQHTGKWHYTIKDSGGTYAHGYCAEGCPGHDSPQAAYDHYREWLLDHRLRFVDDRQTQKICAVCTAWTTHRALITDSAFERLIVLCEAHATRETVAQLIPIGVDIFD